MRLDLGCPLRGHYGRSPSVGGRGSTLRAGYQAGGGKGQAHGQENSAVALHRDNPSGLTQDGRCR